MSKRFACFLFLLAICSITLGVIFLAFGIYVFEKSDEDNESNLASDAEWFSLEMQPEDCFEGEQYDADEKVCFIECDSDAECDALEAEIDANAESIGDDYFEGDKDYDDYEQGEENDIATYRVQGDNIVLDQKHQVSQDLVSLQNDTAKHQEIWNYFVKIIPRNYRGDISAFSIFTDGKDGTLAAVYQSDDNVNKWVLAIDITDAYLNGKLENEDFKFSLIHEYGHILTLNSSQVDPDESLFNASSDEQADKFYLSAEDDCKPKFFTGEGCSHRDSYINSFFQKYWRDIFELLQAIESIEDGDEYNTKFDAFYEKYKDRFVTDYAATNPGEDIAETWAAFILQKEPTGDTIADQKVKFFYEYQELVRLREVIRARL